MNKFNLLLVSSVFAIFFVGCAHQEPSIENSVSVGPKSTVSRNIANENDNSNETKVAIHTKAKKLVTDFRAVTKPERQGNEQCDTSEASQLVADGNELVKLAGKAFRVEEIYKLDSYGHFTTELTKKFKLHEKVDGFNRPLTGISCKKTYLDVLEGDIQHIALAHFLNWYLDPNTK